MSATPTQAAGSAMGSSVVPAIGLTAIGSPMEEGNRVLASIARQEGLRALLAFSSLHEQIRNRREATGTAIDWDLFQTERFVFDEVLQLICDRTQAITGADAIVIALAEGSATGPDDQGPAKRSSALVCRATAGLLPISRGVHLVAESEFLRECMDSGDIVRCEDSASDARVEVDFSQQVGARSTVLIPLGGRNECVGVLQAFSTRPWAFTDQDVRCLDLFAELVLSALRPEDQDRRIHWLADVADEVLQTKSHGRVPAAAAAISNISPTEVIQATAAPVELPAETAVTESGVAESQAQEIIAADQTAIAEPVLSEPPASSNSEVIATSDGAAIPVAEIAFSANAVTATPFSPISVSATPVAVDLSDLKFADIDLIAPALSSEQISGDEERAELDPFPTLSLYRERARSENVHAGNALSNVVSENVLSIDMGKRAVSRADRGGSYLATRPGLSVVIGLVAVAALFFAGVWWGMQAHGRSAAGMVQAKMAAASLAATVSGQTAAAPHSITSPAAPDILSPSVSDNLLDPAQSAAQSPSLVPVPASKLGDLPKVTGVRHWSSSVGSTVVIDMQDQVPYEVHRLMSPERIYFDLQNTGLTSDLDGKTLDVGDVSLSRVRVAQPIAGVTRIVLDTKDGSNFSVSMESNPYRLVVELRDSVKSASNHLAPIPSKSVSTAALGAVSATSLTAPSLSARLLPAKTGKFRIVLDAGHGGWDLGTVGRQGLLEKDLVLDVTRRLGKLLRDRLGSEVMFTRNADEYLPLDQRADFANQAQADLFVSVHANYSSSATARGVETYYTNQFAAPGSKEVRTDGTLAQPKPVSLSAGGLHDRIEESRHLAASVQRSLFATLAAKSPDIRDRGIKDSAFVVLTGTTMPAILTEISFVSSPADEHNLQSEAYRQQIAEALLKGIARYQESSPRTKLAQLQAAADKKIAKR